MYLFLKLFIICIIQQVNSLSNLNIINKTAKYDETNSFTINATTMYVILFPVVTNTVAKSFKKKSVNLSKSVDFQMNPYRIKTAAKNLKELLPILIVARQETQINSWQLPYMLETTTHSDILYFDSVSHTMCPDDMRDITSGIQKVLMLKHQKRTNFRVVGWPIKDFTKFHGSIDDNITRKY